MTPEAQEIKRLHKIIRERDLELSIVKGAYAAIVKEVSAADEMLKSVIRDMEFSK